MDGETTEATAATTPAPAASFGANPAGTTAGPEATAVARLKGIDLTRFRCLRNAAYHEDRERWFVGWHKLLMFIVVLSGTTAFGAVMNAGGNKLAMWASLLATVAGVADLVFELDTKARLHAKLKGRMFDILARCEVAQDCRDLDMEMTRIYADEPPTKHGVNAIAFNAAMDAMGRPVGEKYDLQPWQILLRHVWPFRANEFPTIADRTKKAVASSSAGTS